MPIPAMQIVLEGQVTDVSVGRLEFEFLAEFGIDQVTVRTARVVIPTAGLDQVFEAAGFLARRARLVVRLEEAPRG